MDNWSDLSEQLKKLGVQFGKDKPLPATVKKKIPIESLVPGHEFDTIFGKVFSSNHQYPDQHQHGAVPLKPFTRYEVLCDWAQANQLAESDISDFIFLDTETTGLSGGTGTIPFMIGAARFRGDQFVLEQFFLRNPSEEKAQLAALSKFVDGARAIVSYNGKSFDLPIINTRYILNRLNNPFDEMDHIDLLHITRRVWKRRLKQCNLGNIEKEILEFYRTNEDIPGYLVPEFYRNYILDGDASQIANIFYHNEIDVVSLSALFTTLAAILEDPTSDKLSHAEDIYSIGRLMESLNREVLAEQLYASEHILAANHQELMLSLLSRARIFKRNKNFEEAVPLWQQAWDLGASDAALELAKYYEHNAREYQNALDITNQLLRRVQESKDEAIDRRVIAQLTHRRNRLLNKLEGSKLDG
ncbi:MAG: ribonuclease H-like domain-containing protein [Anaerolineaceae bacterium]|jgi:hypothetical protein|nr:ribonuclease H-like domain-containing protein [Anaerolineaceae bacterium]MDD4042068.1 ribonuclease H-like domain-containing protein [Anaerolineaceae bacterium]MDD4578250.1 ribonuclease H-like domain-containing protein [Anaerolineaceae bacterium]